MTEQEIQQVITIGGNGLRNLDRLIAPLLSLPNVTAAPVGHIPGDGEPLPLWRFTVLGPNSSDPIRIGVFGSIHGDEPAGALAAASLLRRLASDPGIAGNFLLHVYPVCNPAGFARNSRFSAQGFDLNREFWKNSNAPEIRMLEGELKGCHFHGLVQLHADDTSDGIYGFVRGHTLTENLLRPALREAGKILPRNVNATIDGFAARDGIIFDQYEGILAAPPEVTPVPFEIVLETPQLAPLSNQVQALETAVLAILAEYRRLISFAADI
jgi:murein peptide amidase A